MTKIHAQSVQGMVDAAGGVVLTGGGVALTSVQLAKFVALVAEYATTPPHCPKGDGPCIRGCKGWECRDGWPDDRVTCGGGLPGDPNGQQAALAVEGLVRKYEGAMLRETLREVLSEAYLMGAQNILGQLR